MDLTVLNVTYNTQGVRYRIVAPSVHGGRFEMKIQPCGTKPPGNMPRVTVVTTTTRILPQSYDGDTVVDVKRLPGNTRCMIMITGRAVAALPQPAQNADGSDADVWPAIKAMLGEIMPGYQFV